MSHMKETSSRMSHTWIKLRNKDLDSNLMMAENVRSHSWSDFEISNHSIKVKIDLI